MNPIFKKLQFKDQEKIVILQAPESFRSAMEEMKALTRIMEEVNEEAISWILAFAEKSPVLDGIYQSIEGKMSAHDPVLWIAYPKKSSTRYKSDIHRDSGHWAPLGKMGFEGVRSVAIDEDWSALRFRQVDHIKKMTRNQKLAMSKKGKERTGD
ncbi:MAG: hypothetical protein MRZ79_22900 [Bacteroidia bacterium]|nr:hypothetical protein [Bacteroidia bacterium]